MRRILITALILIVNIVFQSSVLPFFEIRGIIPNTSLIIIMSFALLRGSYEGALIGFFAGLLQDTFFGSSLCYYASSTYNRYKSIMFISAGIALENYDIAKEAILAELEACQKGHITAEELESARTQLLSALRSAMDAPNRLDDFFVGQALVATPDIPTQMEMIQGLTVEDLVAVSNKLSLDTIYFLKGVEE